MAVGDPAARRHGPVAWGRLYVEPVEADQEDIDAAVRRMAG